MTSQRISSFIFSIAFIASFAIGQEQPLMFLSSEEYASQLDNINNDISKDSTNPQLIIQQAYLNIKLDNYEKALNDVFKIKELNGNSLYTNLLRAELSIVSKNYGIAERFIDKAEKQATNDHEFYQVMLTKASLLNQQELYKEASEYANEALMINSSLNAIYLSANIYKSLLEFDESENYYSQLLNKVSDRTDLYLEFADLYIKMEDYDKALVYALDAYELNHEDVKTHNYLGNIYYNLNNYPESLSHVNMALKLDPNNYNIFKERAFIYLKLNEVNNACDDMFRSLQNGYMESNTVDLLSIYMKFCEI